MRLDEVHLVTKQLLRSTNAEVSKIEALLETRFPPGFRKWMTTLGAGVLCDWVRVYRLPDLLLLIVEARARWREYDFWPQGHDVLAREAVWGSIVVADTLDGDEAVFHPSNRCGCCAAMTATGCVRSWSMASPWSTWSPRARSPAWT
jgi:hypothetical protein